MPRDMFDTVIVRFGGEIGIKAPWTRKQYERRLGNNIKAVLKHFNIPCSAFVKKAGRLYIKTPKAEKASERISLVFGVSSISPAIETSSNLDDILKISSKLARSRFAENKSFAVHCRRIGKHHYKSQDICALVGERVLTSLPEFKLHVDLKHPEQTLQIEVRDENAYVFTHIVKGVGGLPLGTQPKLVCLLKGDMQSTVACWMTMKRGCPPILLHIEDNVLERKENIDKAKQTAQALMQWNIGFPRKLRVIAHYRKLLGILEERPSSLSVLICKRLMLRTAQRIAETEHAEGIVTGDLIEGRAAQITRFLTIQEEAVKGFPVYRPLLGLGEAETASIARTMGLKKAMIEKVEREELETTAELDRIKAVENKLKLEEIVDECVKSVQILEL